MAGDTAQETRLLQMLDEIRVAVVGKLNAIQKELEVQTAILAAIKEQKVAVTTNVQALDAKSITDAVAKSIVQPQVRPAVPPQFNKKK